MFKSILALAFIFSTYFLSITAQAEQINYLDCGEKFACTYEYVVTPQFDDVQPFQKEFTAVNVDGFELTDSEIEFVKNELGLTEKKEQVVNEPRFTSTTTCIEFITRLFKKSFYKLYICESDKKRLGYVFVISIFSSF